MPYRGRFGKSDFKAQETGFSLLELMVAVVILLAVTGTVMTAMMQMALTQGTIANRTEMHSSVRSATEVLQQEIEETTFCSISQQATPKFREHGEVKPRIGEFQT